CLPSYAGHVAYALCTRGILSAWHSVWVFPGHVERSGDIRRVLPAWVSWTRGSLELLPDVVSRLRHSGTRGSLGTLPGILSRSITRDTWHFPKVSPKGVSKGLSGWL